jgi:cytochrome c peroxidase
MMNRSRSLKSRPPGIVLAALGLVGTLAGAGAQADGLGDLFDGRLPNNFPFLNSAGTAATFSTAGFVDLTNAFHVPQGTNGRSCESCHLPQVGWSIRPIDVELKFLLTQGDDPIFNKLDANSPNPDVSSLQAKRASYSMLRRGLFRRGGAIADTFEFTIAEFDDPLGAGGSPTQIMTYRRPLATANFHIAQNIGWHDQNTNGSRNVPDGLFRQADGNITGAQERPPPAPKATVDAIVSYELGLAFAQQFSFTAGLLTACGAKGGPENLSAQLPAKGRFDLFDAWKDLTPGSCGSRAADRKRAQIARGQQVFNGEVPGVTGNCNGCHNAVNNGSNADARLFDVHASREEHRALGMPLYTLRNKDTGETHKTTDPGRALRSGKWADLDRFKVPSLRGVVARPPYFHNGIAANLREVVAHYETELGFSFEDPADREALIAFLEAL